MLALFAGSAITFIFKQNYTAKSYSEFTLENYTEEDKQTNEKNDKPTAMLQTMLWIHIRL